jgi:hypothetical protein
MPMEQALPIVGLEIPAAMAARMQAVLNLAQITPQLS